MNIYCFVVFHYIYMLSIRLDVTSVQPQMGSVGGGTVLTITGRFFVLKKEHVKVTVGGKI